MNKFEVKVETPIVAAIQFKPEILEVENNLRIAQQMVFEAGGKGASLIVLPELCISGYVLESKREASLCAQTKDGYQTEAFIPLARRFNVHIVFGYVELSEDKLYNSAAVVGPQGLVSNCRKHNRWGSDNIWATPSDDLHPVVITRAGRTGVLICRDVMNNYRDSYKFFNPESRFYKNGSVDTIALLSNWGSDYGYPDSTWVELAEETGANVVVSNRVGKERDLRFKGGSAIIDRNGKIWTNGSSFTDPAIVGGCIVL